MPSGRSHAGTPGGGPCKEMGNEPLRNLRLLRFPTSDFRFNFPISDLRFK